MKAYIRECDACGKVYSVSQCRADEPIYICCDCARNRRYGASRMPRGVQITRQRTWERYSGYGG